MTIGKYRYELKVRETLQVHRENEEFYHAAMGAGDVLCVANPALAQGRSIIGRKFFQDSIECTESVADVVLALLDIGGKTLIERLDVGLYTLLYELIITLEHRR